MRTESERGFSLIEVIMAMMVFTVGIAVISSIIADISKKNLFSQAHTQAVIMAQNKIEELLNEGYRSDALVEGVYENPLNPVDATGDSSGIYYQYWEIEDLRPIPRSKQITSWVEWYQEGELKSVRLTAVCIDETSGD